MQPSSLVFLVIIAVWAAYFVQYWVRRREHLATARSVDQFSESMRVLERRTALPVADLSVPSPRSYAVSPARAVRAQVLVKRAETTTFTMTATPGATTRPAASVDLGTIDGRDDAWGWEEPTPAPGKSGRGADHEPAPAAVRPARKVRGLTLLASLAAVLLALPLAAFGALPWPAVLVPVAAVAASVAWVRQAVAAEQAARRAARRTNQAPADRHPAQRPVRERPTHAVTERATQQRPRRREAAAPQATTTAPAHPAPEGGDHFAADDAPARPQAPALYDFQEVERGLAAPAPVSAAPAAAAAGGPASAAGVVPAPLVDEDDIPLTWDPVPVPRPTYTMKSRATRPAPTAADLVGDADTEYAAYEQEPARRVAGA